jgi:D-amino-acid dehydrogenase
MSDRRTVAIVGGGVIGLCSAWYALREGYRVILVERGAPDHDACSLGNSGLVVPSHFIPLASPGVTLIALQSLFDPKSPLRLHPRLDPDYLRWCWRFWRSANPQHVARTAPALRDLALLSLRCYGELADEWQNSFSLQKRGLLMLSRTKRDFEEEAHTAEMARKLGIEALVLDRKEAQRREPTMKMSIAGAVLYPADAHLTPQAFVAEITRRLQNAGVEFRWSTEVTGWRANGSRVKALQTRDDEIGADDFVIASGAWSMKIAAPLGLRFPLEAGKGYNLTLRRPRALPVMSAILNEARIAVTPMGETLRFAGTLQLAGLDSSIDERRVQALIEAVPQYYPEFTTYDFDGIRPWTGLRPCSPDGLPYIGRTGRYQNVLVAAGHAMMGMSLAPATGLVVSEVLAGRRTSAPLDHFTPDRFS